MDPGKVPECHDGGCPPSAKASVTAKRQGVNASKRQSDTQRRAKVPECHRKVPECQPRCHEPETWPPLGGTSERPGLDLTYNVRSHASEKTVDKGAGHC
jgi:hypothetical protein